MCPNIHNFSRYQKPGVVLIVHDSTQKRYLLALHLPQQLDDRVSACANHGGFQRFTVLLLLLLW